MTCYEPSEHVEHYFIVVVVVWLVVLEEALVGNQIINRMSGQVIATAISAALGYHDDKENEITHP